MKSREIAALLICAVNALRVTPSQARGTTIAPYRKISTSNTHEFKNPSIIASSIDTESA
jgi:hypothetical protein